MSAAGSDNGLAGIGSANSDDGDEWMDQSDDENGGSGDGTETDAEMDNEDEEDEGDEEYEGDDENDEDFEEGSSGSSDSDDSFDAEFDVDEDDDLDTFLKENDDGEEHDRGPWSIVPNEDTPVRLPHYNLSEGAIAALPTNEPMRDLFRQVAALLPHCSEDIREAVQPAQQIITDCWRAPSMRHISEAFVQRVLRFWIRIGTMEKAQGYSDAPATAYELTLSFVRTKVETFSKALGTYARTSYARRPSRRAA
ncbi:hypothetical protein OC842_006399, partial [Tilletia horrida]